MTVNQVDDNKMTPLHRAETPRIAKLLLGAGADPLAMDNNGLVPLHVANNIDVIEVLLSKTDINTRVATGELFYSTPFLRSTDIHRPEIRSWHRGRPSSFSI
jgi:ankyrin repeat protein